MNILYFFRNVYLSCGFGFLKRTHAWQQALYADFHEDKLTKRPNLRNVFAEYSFIQAGLGTF